MIAIAIGEVGYDATVGNLASKYKSTPQDWCVAFVQWCAKQAGFDLADAGLGTETLRSAYAKTNHFGDGRIYTPMAGDLIFYQAERYGGGGHTGLVVANILNADGNGGIIYSIEGNTYTQTKPMGVYVIETHYEIDANSNYQYFRVRSNGERKELSKPEVSFGINGGDSYGTIPWNERYRRYGQ
jgi:hypothetical protein